MEKLWAQQQEGPWQVALTGSAAHTGPFTAQSAFPVLRGDRAGGVPANRSDTAPGIGSPPTGSGERSCAQGPGTLGVRGSVRKWGRGAFGDRVKRKGLP